MKTWDDVWNGLGEAFSRLVLELGRVNPRARATTGRTETAIFPFGAYLAFSRSGEPGVEDVVVSVDCKREDGELKLSSDISRGDGYILAEGPEARVSAMNIDVSVPEEALEWLHEVIGFIEASRELVCKELGA